MRIFPVKLVLLAAIGVSLAHSALADAKNLSCISDESVHARKVLRDCEHVLPEPTYIIVYEQPVDDPNGPPIPVKHGEGRDRHGGRGSNSDGGNGGGGGNAGGPN